MSYACNIISKLSKESDKLVSYIREITILKNHTNFYLICYQIITLIWSLFIICLPNPSASMVVCAMRRQKPTVEYKSLHLLMIKLIKPKTDTLIFAFTAIPLILQVAKCANLLLRHTLMLCALSLLMSTCEKSGVSRGYCMARY